MDFMNNIKYRWISLRRNKYIYIYSAILYFMLAFWDPLNKSFFIDEVNYIYRYNFQQSIIVFSILLSVLMVFNEKILSGYKEFYVLYIGNAKQYFKSIVSLLCIINIIPFIIGQVLFLIISFLHNRTIQPVLWLVNLIIVPLEIVTVVMFIVSLLIIIKKTLLICVVYYASLFVLITCNNIYFTIPLIISLLEDEGYYYTFAYPLWVGKILQLIVARILFELSCIKYSKEKI